MESLRRATAADAPAMHRIARAAYSPYLPRMEGRRPGPLETRLVRVFSEKSLAGEPPSALP